MKALLQKIFSKTFGMGLVSNRDMRLLEAVKKELLPANYKPQEYFLPEREIGNNGFSLNVESQLELLRSFREDDFQALFQSIRNNDEINTGFDRREYKSKGLIHNGYYPTPDAEIYAAMISSARPGRIIEVGSGYSTVVARAAMDYIGLDCRLHVIDPEPRRDIENIADVIEYKPVELSSLADIEFTENTFLFIDSSHICRGRGDLPFLYCKILPALPAGVFVHIHDIFIPYDYPDNYFERFYTEEYLLHALLAHSRKFEVVLAAHYLAREQTRLMQDLFGASVGDDPLFFGASFWMRSKL